MLGLFDKTRKAEGLSMSTIVVAAIALIVLVVLIVIFSSRMGIFNKGINDCIDKGGDCVESNPECIQMGGTPIGPCFDPKTGEKLDTICCIKD
ncbi:hypothetical protein JXB31_02480 [Candidatus Woesearchaeota archaeon]|nr:hypothetical protein [Candidatus Woesearchaeota archaeon]